jgi:isopentenyl diphosphate isomerase/L-lactate dehydrogenase-like FMN-dependent dehydrogenase
VNVHEFEPLCRARIPKPAYDFIALGVDNEWTLRRNRQAFDKIAFRPRMLVDTSKMDLSTTLFGEKISMPILVAPTAGHGQVHPEGELATARAAAACETIMVLSTNSSFPLEKVAAAAEFPKWFQLYAGPDIESTRDRVQRAGAAGFKTIVLTVDGPYNSHRERLLHNRVPGLPGNVRRARRDPDAPEAQPHRYRLSPQLTHQLSWSFLKELKSWTKLPVLVKGILTAEDAKLAIQHGAEGIVVSNHGGRYLEYAPATIEVLPEIMDVVKDRIPVIIDSGFRRGTDILKALAMGAKAVLVGRPPLWGLGAYGEAGVTKVLQLLQTELALAMGLCGKPNLDSLDRSVLRMEA